MYFLYGSVEDVAAPLNIDQSKKEKIPLYFFVSVVKNFTICFLLFCNLAVDTVY